jgi:hypothetical protein
MKISSLILLFFVLLTSCLPPAPTASPGEVIYEYIPGQADALFANTGAAPMPVPLRVGTSLISYFLVQKSVADGYANLKYQESKQIDQTTIDLSFVAQKITGAGQIQSVWRIVGRGGNYVGVYANTTSTDLNVNVAAIEQAAFAFLDRSFKRIASAR